MYEKKYRDLLRDIFNGSTSPHVMRDDRTGIGCVSKFALGLTIDISNYSKHLKPGMFVDIINYQYDIEKMAENCNTISNEILTSISSRVKRVYIN